MKRRLLIKSILTTLMISIISACGDDAFNKGGNPSDSDTDIKNFTITGNAGRNNEGNPAVDATENAAAANRGGFDISWGVVTSELYTYQVYLSADDNFDSVNPGADVQIYTGRCGGISASCNALGDISCKLANGTKISCEGNPEKEVGGILVNSSTTAYIFLSVRNEALSSEDQVSQAVEFTF